MKTRVRMRIKRVHSSCVVNNKLKHIHSTNVIPTDKDFIKMPFTACVQGARGSGKTVATVTWVRHMEEAGYVTRTYLISPTAETNKVFKNLRTLSERDICSNPKVFQKALQQVYQRVKASVATYKKYLKQKELYDRYKKGCVLSFREEGVLEEMNYESPVPRHMPRDLLILDDVQGSQLFTNKREDLMVQLTIKHRHVPLSIIFLVQTFHGLPRPIRLNCTIYIVFLTSDEKQLNQLYEHFANVVPREQFFRMYKFATSKPHGFLMIDTDPKTEQHRFRNGFNEFLCVEK